MKESLWGEAFNIDDTKKKTKSILKKIQNPVENVDVTKVIKSKKLPLENRLALIKENVLRILGTYVQDTLVIKTKEQLVSYIDKAIANDIISIDTETNRSLDPLTCILMGPCIYTPGEKNAYIPLNHVNPTTGERLDWQLTEADIKEQFDRLKDTKIIMHHGKFDYQVIRCTCNCNLKIYWDTMVGARILDENELAGLKQQYIEKIDPSIEKYNINMFFENVEYAQVDPEIFALYAATDAYMTYKLYEYQLEQFNLPDNAKIYSVFKNIEMPLIEVAADMELRGVYIDQEYAKRLSNKYTKALEECDRQVSEEVSQLQDKITKWRKSEEANVKQVVKGKEGKSKNEQLTDPPNLDSPLQLSILLYDVLKLPQVDKKTPRGTGEDIIKKLVEKCGKDKFKLGDLILKKRGMVKLLNTFIDKLPASVNPVDRRLHAHFNQLGADTGRFSSSEPNLQNIPSHAKEVRLMFSAAPGCKLVGADFSL